MDPAEAQAERRGIERGKVMQKLEDIEQNQKDGFTAIGKRFDNLKCDSNSEKINELYIAHKDNKVIKQHFIKSIISQGFKASPFVLALGGVAYALIK